MIIFEWHFPLGSSHLMDSKQKVRQVISNEWINVKKIHIKFKTKDSEQSN